MPSRLPDPKDVGRYFALAMVGLEMVAPVVIGLLLDRNLGWSPWGVIVGAIVGLVGGLYHLIILANRFNRQDAPDQKRDSK
jgi:F0F1-type ATP synthase assembly protein I